MSLCATAHPLKYNYTRFTNKNIRCLYYFRDEATMQPNPRHFVVSGGATLVIEGSLEAPLAVDIKVIL